MSLQKHVRFHEAYKPSSCENLQQHERSHPTLKSNHKPFPCYRCEERYETLQLLDRHIITHMRNDRVFSEMHVIPSEPSSTLPEYTNLNNALGTPSARDYYEYAGMPSSSQDQGIPQIQQLGWEDIATTSSQQEICSLSEVSGRMRSFSCHPSANTIVEETDWSVEESIGPFFIPDGLRDDGPSNVEYYRTTSRISMEAGSTPSCYERNEMQEEVDRVVDEIVRLHRELQKSECQKEDGSQNSK
ncbi:hypothetical protein QAD02_011941 [Eretmocerus hayati]|uniref:Uncharacterized protein n=1 Tax=Eretmocerus hayati TaxID=131215 RepID=A0ACC2P302_9HYME|nr:hypothetical protein QAD02_011941 [Eretmocerus hayati]